ncbi:homeodomain-like protein [Tanacetum coccineum]
MATLFANPERQFRAKRDTSPAPIHNIYTFYKFESSESESEDVGEIDIETLTLEYTTFSGSSIENAIEHIGKPKDGSTEHAKNWDELKQNFIQRFCPHAMILEQLGEIRNFKQEDRELLFHTWERYNDLLFKCLFHDLNDHQKVNTFYNGLKGQTRRIVDSNGLITGLTASEALKSIQELADHSHKWHNEESKNTPTPFGIIAEKLKALNHEMDELRIDVRKINTNREIKSLHEEIKSIRTSEISYEKSSPKSNIHPTNLKDTFEHYLKESCKRQDVLNELMKKFMINTEINLKNHDSSIKRLEENVKTFAEKVKRCILKENGEEEPIHTTSVNTKHTQHLQKLVSREIKIEEVSMVKLNARCSAILQNELPPKEKDPGSFILPCAIGLRNLKQINMVIEMADRSMQSPKGIVENVMVKINKFIFPVNFIILDIIEDDKVPIILGRPMLATAHARIDVFGKKDIFRKINEFDEPRDLEELLLSYDDLGIFPNDNDLLPNFENHDTMFLSPPGLARLNDDSSEMFCNLNSNSSISMDDFVKMDDVWDNLDFRDLTNEATKFPVKPEFLSSSNIIHLHSLYNLQITYKIRSNIVECTVTNLVEFINTHQSVLLVFILIYEASGIGVKRIENKAKTVELAQLVMYGWRVLVKREVKGSSPAALLPILFFLDKPRVLYSVEDLVPIPSESEDTSDSDKEYDFPFCDNSVTFSNPLFDANDDECFNPRGDIDEIDVFLEIDDSFPEYETFCFNIEEKSSGSTTTHSDYSLPDYEAFYFDDDHIKEKSSGSTTTHSDFSLPEYDPFIFDLSIDPFSPAYRSVSHHEDFTDELAHIISPPEYDRFYFDLEIVP